MRRLVPERFPIFSNIAFSLQETGEELNKWADGNEEAGQRARVQSLKLEKLLKNFRKESVRMYKKKLGKLNG